MKNNPNYQEQINIENQRKLNNILDELPRFCQQFFRGIEYRTSSRTRIAYGYDIRLFFQYQFPQGNRKKQLQPHFCSEKC